LIAPCRDDLHALPAFTHELMTTHTNSATVVNKFADNVPVTMTDLALALRVSRFAIYRWMQKGYVFEFGPLTTPGHCKRWLAKNADQLKRKPPTRKASPEEELLEAKLKELK
jgi:malate synthase